jgi:hypothetical protein
MRKSSLFVVLSLVLVPLAAHAVGPTVNFTLPALNTTPGTFGSLPFPCDLYFDQGQPGDGDGTLLNTGANIGLGVDVIQTNTASIQQALDLMDGFGTTSATFFFFSGAIDPGSLPASPVLSPALTDSVFCVDTATLTPVPIEVKANVDTRIPNVLSVLPVPGKPLKGKASYACVVRRAVTGGGDPVEPSADWISVRDGASANSDADAIFDSVVSALGGAGVLASDIAGMTVFTTESTSNDLRRIRDDVLPTLAVPTADFTSRPEYIFSGPVALNNLVGANPHADIATIASGYYESPRFQTHDPNGDGVGQDVPLPPSFVNCAVPCETTDERFTRDITGKPIVIDVPKIPFTVVIPAGSPPAGGWPIIIQQHGLGGQRDTVVAFGELDAAKGFASIGIDAVAHGYRLLDCGPGSVCGQDNANGLGGTAVPDGVTVDGTVLGQSISFLAVNLGFFQAFHNFLGIRDNFRQTYADLLSLVRLIKGHSIDSGLGTTIDDNNIFYMGHSLGGLMGAGFVPIETDLKAALLNAAGGGLTSQLFANSSIGGGAQALVNGILGLDPLNLPDQFALSTNLTQMIVDPADGVNSASLLLTPDAGSARNVLLVEDFGDQVVPNQAGEALAIAANLSIMDPYVQNLHMSPLSLPIANPGTPRFLTANAASGTATAALLQNGPATHAQSLSTQPASVTFIPEFAHADDFLLTGNGFPTLDRSIRVPNVGIFDNVVAWFRDIVDNGPPGTFNFTGQFNYNSIQNIEIPAGPSANAFFERTVDAGGALATEEPTSDVVLLVTSNAVATRVTAGRTTLGTGPLATDSDVPPGPFSTVGTPGILPFFVSLQRQIPGVFSTELGISYTTTDLLLAGIPPNTPVESALVIGMFTPGACAVGAAVCSEDSSCGANGPCLGATYTVLPTSVTLSNHTAFASGVTSFGTFAVLHPDVLAGGYRPPLIPGGGGPNADCRAEWEVRNLTNTPFLDRRGRVNSVQTCKDGDPLCDQDGMVNSTCVFSMGICFNQVDPSLASCVPDTTAEYRLLSPRPSAKNALDVTNAQALLSSLTTLGGTLGGTHADVVTFNPALVGNLCTAFTPVSVPTKGSKAGRRTIHGRARPASGPGDSDRLTLICTP